MCSTETIMFGYRYLFIKVFFLIGKFLWRGMAMPFVLNWSSIYSAWSAVENVRIQKTVMLR